MSPMTTIECPGCEHPVHTDDLLEGKCVTNGCGCVFDQKMYDDWNVHPAYVPPEYREPDEDHERD